MMEVAELTEMSGSLWQGEGEGERVNVGEGGERRRMGREREGQKRI